MTKVRLTGHHETIDTLFRFPSNDATQAKRYIARFLKEHPKKLKQSPLAPKAQLLDLLTLDGFTVTDPVLMLYTDLHKDATKKEAGYWLLDFYVN